MLLSKQTDRTFVGISNVTAKTFKCRLVEIIEYSYPLVGNVVTDIAPHEINKAMKLLWLLNPDIEKVEYISELGVITEISFK